MFVILHDNAVADRDGKMKKTGMQQHVCYYARRSSMLTEIRQDDKTVVQQHVCYYARRSCDADRDGKMTKLECSSMFVILHDEARC